VFRDYNLAIDQLSLFGSLVTGIPAETMAQATSSFSAWCLAVLSGAFFQTKACSPCALTRGIPQWHLCGTQRGKPSRIVITITNFPHVNYRQTSSVFRLEVVKGDQFILGSTPYRFWGCNPP